MLLFQKNNDSNEIVDNVDSFTLFFTCGIMALVVKTKHIGIPELATFWEVVLAALASLVAIFIFMCIGIAIGSLISEQRKNKSKWGKAAIDLGLFALFSIVLYAI